MRSESAHLAWFLGPKAENAEVMEQLLLAITRDYFHWRRNYFPEDPIQISKLLQRDFVEQHDLLSQHVHELLAQLRRNFPFYSPRYVAHQLSDTVISSTLGYIAGMLYNPNNVTPEAAPVTTELEIEACSSLLTMLGFAPPPVPAPDGEDAKEYYRRQNQREYGWCHITSGGTVANMEALWAARQIRYFPLSVRDVSFDKDLAIMIQMPNARVGVELKNVKGKTVDIREVDPYDLLLIKPNEAIYLLSKYISALRQKDEFSQLAGDRLGTQAWDLLKRSKHSLSHGIGEVLTKFPPAVLVCGTRHYSLAKAVDLLGIGQNNLISVRPDASFRMDVTDLEHKLLNLIKARRVPLCVVASVGTTEEGAVDPVHKITDLRRRLEEEHNASFWIHIDSAWGGYIRSLFCIDPQDQLEAMVIKLSKQFGIDYRGNLVDWHRAFAAQIDKKVGSETSPSSAGDSRPASSSTGTSDTPDVQGAGEVSKQPDEQARKDTTDGLSARREGVRTVVAPFEERIQHALQGMERLLDEGRIGEYINLLARFPERFKDRNVDPALTGEWRLGLLDIIDWIQRYTKEKVEVGIGPSAKRLRLIWPDVNVGSAFIAFPLAESVTVDPHKLGYGHYPSGCVAFRNDRVRLFVQQKAPYITASVQDPLLHLPPRHSVIDSTSDPRKIAIDSFSPFILEGSRPGAAAAALWLSIKAIPLTARAQGMIIRESLVAARTFYEWLIRWSAIKDADEHGIDYEFISATPDMPDTNIVTFVVKKKTSSSLLDMNKLTKAVYKKFAIESEFGERKYSYSQPFFISNTTFDIAQYPVESLQNLFGRCGLSAKARTDYLAEGLIVLRATVMNPYLNHARKGSPNTKPQDFARLFVEELGSAAADAVKLLSQTAKRH